MQRIKKTLTFLYEQFYYYFLYIVKHPISALVMLVGVLVSYVPYAFATDYYVDSEVVINIAGTNYNWLEIGRYGLVFTRKLLNTDWYNPYYTGILMLLFLWLTGMTCSYLCGRLFPKLNPAITTLGSLVFLTYPTFTEQYYFHFQSAEITFGLWLSMLAAGMFYLFVKQKKWSCFLLTIPVYVLTFAIYQSFIPLALCTYLVIFLALIFKEETADDTVKRSILGSIVHFVISLSISQGINTLCLPASGYLSDQVIWTSGASLKDSVLAVAAACLRMLTGHGIFYTTLLLFAVILCAASFWLYRKKPVPSLILGMLAAVGIAATPFALTLLMGEQTAIRSQFTYGLAAVFLLYFSMESFWEFSAEPTAQFGPATGVPDMASKKQQLTAKLLAAERFVMIAILLCITISQIGTVRYIWNAHTYVADYDRETTEELIKAMYDSFIVDDKKGTIFWGYLQPETPYDEVIKDSPSYLFTSVLNLEHDMEPYCFFSTNRILGYMESMGHAFTYPTLNTHNLSVFAMYYHDLTVFPEEGCSFNDREAFTLNLGNCPGYYYNK